jgi:hypothetical protein
MGSACSSHGGERLESLAGRDSWVYLGVERSLKEGIREIGFWVHIQFIWLTIKTGDGLCEHGDEHFCSIKGGDFLD